MRHIKGFTHSFLTCGRAEKTLNWRVCDLYPGCLTSSVWGTVTHTAYAAQFRSLGVVGLMWAGLISAFPLALFWDSAPITCWLNLPALLRLRNAFCALQRARAHTHTVSSREHENKAATFCSSETCRLLKCITLLFESSFYWISSQLQQFKVCFLLTQLPGPAQCFQQINTTPLYQHTWPWSDHYWAFHECVRSGSYTSFQWSSLLEVQRILVF